MEKIRFITDSASDMNHPREDVTILPLHIRFGDDEYADGVTISHREFYEKLIECDTLPTTSLVSPAVFEDAYEQAVSAGETVIVITISGKLSGTCQSARIAAEDYEGKVFVVDSMNATIGERILVEYGLQLKDQGKSAEEIVSILEKEKSKIHTMGLLDTLEYLKKGGRISSTVAFIGGALAIKPVVAVSDGEIIMLGKARGSKNGSNFLIREIEKADGVDFSRPFCLGYTGLSDELLQKYIHDSEHLWKDYAKELPISTLGATIGTHVGPGAVAVAFFEHSLRDFLFVFCFSDQADFFAFFSFICLTKVRAPSTTRKIARTAIAAAKNSWNQSPHAAVPAPIALHLLITVITRLVRVAASMNTIGKKNILLFLPTSPSHAATAIRAIPASSWFAAPNRPQIWLKDRPPRIQPISTMDTVPNRGCASTLRAPLASL